VAKAQEAYGKGEDSSPKKKKEPYVSVKEPYISAKEPYIFFKEPHILCCRP